MSLKNTVSAGVSSDAFTFDESSETTFTTEFVEKFEYGKSNVTNTIEGQTDC
jgi:hypothetical protein